MKVIFLDIDGVMNNDRLIEQFGCDAIGDNFVDLLKEIVDKTKAKIVLSSTWRLFQKSRKIVQATLNSKGMEFIDCTIDGQDFKNGIRKKLGHHVERREEIQEWLNRHEVGDFVILDDDSDAEIKGHFFQTDFENGLTQKHVDDVIHHFTVRKVLDVISLMKQEPSVDFQPTI